MLCGKFRDTARRRMNAQEEFVKRKGVVEGNDNFAIEHKLLWLQSQERFDNIGKVARKGLASFGLKIDVFAAAKSKAPKPIPFGFVLPLGALGNFRDEQRLHR